MLLPLLRSTLNHSKLTVSQSVLYVPQVSSSGLPENLKTTGMGFCGFCFLPFFVTPTQSSQGYSSQWLSAWCQPISLPRKCAPEFTFPRLPAVLFVCFCFPPPLFFLFYKSYFVPLLIKMTDLFYLQINTVLLTHQVSLHDSLTLLRKWWVLVKFCKVPRFTQVTE